MSRWTAIGRSKANRRAQVKPQAKAIRYGTLLAAAVFAFLSVEVLADPPASTSSSDKESSTESPKATGKFEPFKSESKTSTGSVTVGGQTIANATIDAWQDRSGAPLIELWGMTEIAGLGTTHALYAPPVPGSIGVALPGIEVRVADLEDVTRDAAPGVPGELMVRGPIVMMGYFGNPEETARTIEPDGWLHTGDIAYADETGHFFVVDRRKDLIITAGYNVYPAEIERVLAAHPAVAMVGRPGQGRGQG